MDPLTKQLNVTMKLFRTGLFFILLFTSFSANSRNPEKLVISESERGQLNFENEQIAAEYVDRIDKESEG